MGRSSRVWLLIALSGALVSCGRLGFGQLGSTGSADASTDAATPDAVVVGGDRDGDAPSDAGAPPVGGGCSTPIPQYLLADALATYACRSVNDFDSHFDENWPDVSVEICRGDALRELGAPELGLPFLLSEVGRTITYDPAAAARCLGDCDTVLMKTWVGQRSSEVFRRGGSCEDVFVGSLALDASCRHSEQCAGDAYCAVTDPTGACGTCQPRVPIGAGCTNDRHCSPIGATGVVLCERGSCGEWIITRQEIGAPCGGPFAPGVGMQDRCVVEAVCDHTTDICVPKSPVGAACTRRADDCVPDSICDRATNVCVLPEIGRTAGAPCEGTYREARQCSPSHNLQCGTSGSCECVTPGCRDPELGDPCVYPGSCGPGRYCDRGRTDTCLARAAIGAACTGAAECLEGNCGPAGCAQYCQSR